MTAAIFAIVIAMIIPPAFSALRNRLSAGDLGKASCALPLGKLRLEVPEGRIPVAILAPGSFSPPTLLHLRMFEEARDALERSGNNFAVVGGYMSPVHDAYGKASLAPAHHRLSMAEAAVSDSDWIMADGWECACRDRWTPTVKVVERFAAELNKVAISIGTKRPEVAQVRTVMLCGGDVLQSFNDTKKTGERLWTDEEIEVLLGQHGVVCVGRSEVDLEAWAHESPILKTHLDNLFFAKPRALSGISSSVVRAHLASNESIRYLVHDKVREYILDHKLNELPNWQ